MTDDEIRNWYQAKMQYAATLVDYLIGIGQNNRILQTIYHNVNTGGGTKLVVGPNPNRVAITFGFGSLAGANFYDVILIQTDNDQLGGNAVFEHVLLIHEPDVAAVTPSPVMYSPFHHTILTFGPAIQKAWLVDNQSIAAQVWCAEVLMNPKCCEYLGVQKPGMMEPQHVPEKPRTGRY